MKRLLLCGTIFLLLAGCQVAPERVPLQPLPETGPSLPYAELLTRARAQANAANDAFYVNRWADLEDYAKGLEQTARFLAKATEVPAKNKDILNEVSGDLAKSALKLKASAAAHDVKDTTEAMRQINSTVRQLHLRD